MTKRSAYRATSKSIVKKTATGKKRTFKQSVSKTDVDRKVVKKNTKKAFGKQATSTNNQHKKHLSKAAQAKAYLRTIKSLLKQDGYL